MPRKEIIFGKADLAFLLITCRCPVPRSAVQSFSQKEASATIRPIKDTPRRLFWKAGNDRFVKKREFVKLVVHQFRIGPMAPLARQCLEQGRAFALEMGQIRGLADAAFGIG